MLKSVALLVLFGPQTGCENNNIKQGAEKTNITRIHDSFKSIQ